MTLFNEGKDIDYWSPSSFHNGPPKSYNQDKSRRTCHDLVLIFPTWSCMQFLP